MNTDEDIMARIEEAHEQSMREAEIYRFTKREQIAAMALQGILGNAYWNEHGEYTEKAVADCAVAYADALLSALKETGK